MLTSFLEIYAAIALSTENQAHADNVKVEPLIAYEESLPASFVPIKKLDAVAPVIDAEAAIIVDFETGAVLYQKNSRKRMQIASITKLMTAIVALDESKLDKDITVSSTAAQTGGSKIWLLSGERISVESLLFAILIHSGNDAAVAIAEGVGGDTEAFVEKMNAKAKRLKLYNTHFENPIGFDNIENYSTVSDLALLARYSYRKPFIRNAVRKRSMSISSIDGNQEHTLESTNELLGSYLNVLGLKTGHTEEAGLCFVSIIENERGNKIITVVLDSPARFTETKRLAGWAFKSYIW